MPRTKLFQKKRPTVPERTAIRHLCADLLQGGRSHAEQARLADLLAPIEQRLILPLLSDIADGTGYGKSPLSLTTDRKSYYLRKNHVYYCIFSHMKAEIENHMKGASTNG